MGIRVETDEPVRMILLCGLVVAFCDPAFLAFCFLWRENDENVKCWETVFFFWGSSQPEYNRTHVLPRPGRWDLGPPRMVDIRARGKLYRAEQSSISAEFSSTSFRRNFRIHSRISGLRRPTTTPLAKGRNLKSFNIPDALSPMLKIWRNYERSRI